jgi:hypothetical protein
MTTRLTKKQIIARETAFAASTPKDTTALLFAGGDPTKATMNAIDADRQTRWAPVVAAMPVPEELQSWAGQMTAKHGNPKVRVWRNEVSWILALLIVRYGEAEYYWPETFSADDAHRALRWLADNRVPEGVTYLPRVEG